MLYPLSYGRDVRTAAGMRRSLEYTVRPERACAKRRPCAGFLHNFSSHPGRCRKSEPCMDLLIVRHAIAFERNVRRWRDDGERPLSPEGMVRARKAAAGLKYIAERPQCVLSSPLVRAKQTAAVAEAPADDVSVPAHR